MTALTDTLFSHPVLHPWQLVLDTPAMAQLRGEITQWLWTGLPGAIIAGPARVGKTTALDAVCDDLVDRSGRHIAVFRVSMPMRDQFTVVSVFRQLCTGAGLEFTQRHTADQLADRYIHCIADAMAETGIAQAVLMVDECQRLTPKQFNAFAELYDRLRALERALLVVFVGNDAETWSLIDGMDPHYYAHLHGRFFRVRREFRGISSAQEVGDCLRQYDTRRHPPESGRTFVAEFLPEAVAAGFRLASASSLLWRVFRDYQKAYKLDAWGMQSFAITTNTLLTDFLPRYGVDALDEQMVEEALRMSGLIPSLVHTIQ
ncbi:ATP-binding protein [Marinobacter sp. R17]|uniref:ATP-binding protein n=1 Tax=Marinobacter sp. R17 TaxID=2484250 RepID=UPI000F4B012E|nr:ATP-binding protein [Marinobacter sp. R17]ROT99905.1 ATP-binding protein [Marinobacter sp. R17]